MVDERGSLCVVNGDEDFPFEVKRVFWIFGVPFGECRGKHAHQTCAEVVVPVKGSLTARITDANGTTEIRLSNPSEALYIPEMVCVNLWISRKTACVFAWPRKPMSRKDISTAWKNI